MCLPSLETTVVEQNTRPIIFFYSPKGQGPKETRSECQISFQDRYRRLLNHLEPEILDAKMSVQYTDTVWLRE